MMEMIDEYKDKFERVAVAEPLLGESVLTLLSSTPTRKLLPRPLPLPLSKDAGFDELGRCR